MNGSVSVRAKGHSCLPERSGESGLALLGSLLLVSVLAIMGTAFGMIMAADLGVSMSHQRTTQLQYTMESAVEIASRRIATDATLRALVLAPADSTVPVIEDSTDFGKFEIYSYPDSFQTAYIRELRTRAWSDKAWLDVFWDALIPPQDPRAYFPVSATTLLWTASGTSIRGGQGVLVTRDASITLGDSVSSLVVTPPFTNNEPQILLTDSWPYSYRVSGDGTTYYAQVLPDDKYFDHSASVQNFMLSQPDPRGITIDHDGGYVYWVDRNWDQIRKANLNNPGSSWSIRSVGGDPRDLDIDQVNGKIYWTDNSTRRIERVNLDGSFRQSLVSGTGDSYGIVVAPDLDLMFWTDRSNGAIWSADLDGNGVATLITGLDDPRPLDIDLRREKLYWSDDDTRIIYRANLDGTNIETLVTGIGESQGLVVDPVLFKMYWTDRSNDRIWRADMDGANVESIVVNGVDTWNMSSPRGIAIDMRGDFDLGDTNPPNVGDRIYWTDNDNDRIQRYEVNTVRLIPNSNNPMGIWVWNGSGTGYYYAYYSPFYYFGIDGTLYCPSSSGIFLPYEIGLRTLPRVHDGPSGPEYYPAIVSKGNLYNYYGTRDVISGYVYVRDWFYNNTTAPYTANTTATILGAVSAGSVYFLAPADVTWDPRIAEQPPGPLSPSGIDWPTIVLRRRRYLVLPTALGGGG